ncbi:MAG: hypothetical protein K2L12_05830 [Clostridia bacterium]|nr:hypothetical protein [Clostridia bacterium]
MIFFTYKDIAGIFTDSLWVQVLVGGLCYALVFAFQGIALYTIAAREGYGKKWMAFVPFFNTYYIGVCAQKNKFYKVDAKKLSLATAIFEAVLFALYIFNLVACILVLPYEHQYLTTDVLGNPVYGYEISGYPESLNWAAWVYANMEYYILSTLDLVLMIIQICVLICFFQTYAARRYVLFTVTSVLFPIQGILFFVVRNNTGVNYRQYVMAMHERQYQIYQQQQQYYNQNPYNRQNPYNQNPYNRNPYNQNPYGPQGAPSQSKPDDPFEDFGGNSNGNNNGNNGGGNSGSSPFDEFD